MISISLKYIRYKIDLMQIFFGFRIFPRDHHNMLVVRHEIILSYLQDIKRVSNDTTNTTGNGSGQKFHVEGSIRTSTKVISDRSISCFTRKSTRKT